jgi:hypothetical protein
MKIMNFTYTKPDGKTSKRTFVSIRSPFTDYFGVDISELSEEDQAIFTAEMQSIEDAKTNAINELMIKFDVKNNYRKFLAERMSDISVEDI